MDSFFLSAFSHGGCSATGSSQSAGRRPPPPVAHRCEVWMSLCCDALTSSCLRTCSLVGVRGHLFLDKPPRVLAVWHRQRIRLPLIDYPPIEGRKLQIWSWCLIGWFTLFVQLCQHYKKCNKAAFKSFCLCVKWRLRAEWMWEWCSFKLFISFE